MPRPSQRAARLPAKSGRCTLAVDIGGSGVKMLVLDERGDPLSDRERVPTPRPALPAAVIKLIRKMAEPLRGYARVSVGFPGVIRDGVVETAFNLDSAWLGFPLAAHLAKRLGKPVRVANDADVQGFGCISGKGVELVITLGTGLGSSLFVDGKLVPNLQMAHHPFRKGSTYEDRLGHVALKKLGKKRWNNELGRAIKLLRATFNCDRLYIGGGNARKIKFVLPKWAGIVPNVAGLWGGIALWHEWKRVARPAS